MAAWFMIAKGVNRKWRHFRHIVRRAERRNGRSCNALTPFNAILRSATMQLKSRRLTLLARQPSRKSLSENRPDYMPLRAQITFNTWALKRRYSLSCAFGWSSTYKHMHTHTRRLTNAVIDWLWESFCQMTEIQAILSHFLVSLRFIILLFISCLTRMREVPNLCVCVCV